MNWETPLQHFRELMEEDEKRAYCGAEDIAKIKPVLNNLVKYRVEFRL
ncbi:MAG: hypothetical protein HC907_20085 [Richelia sp. SM1_7_0]|nr:hypothetical protein [Richelia sp. SM1_7_0]